MKRLTFSPQMAMAIRDGHKLETRRGSSGLTRFRAGDLVRLTSHWYVPQTLDNLRPCELPACDVHTEFDERVPGWFCAGEQPKLRQARFVPLGLEPRFPLARIVSVHAEELGQIDESAAQREGFRSVAEFIELWTKIHGDFNPLELVDVIRFEVVRMQGDA